MNSHRPVVLLLASVLLLALTLTGAHARQHPISRLWGELNADSDHHVTAAELAAYARSHNLCGGVDADIDAGAQAVLKVLQPAETLRAKEHEFKVWAKSKLSRLLHAGDASAPAEAQVAQADASYDALAAQCQGKVDLGCLTSALSKRLLVSRCAAMIMGMWTLELFSPNPAVRSIDRVEFQQGLSLAVATTGACDNPTDITSMKNAVNTPDSQAGNAFNAAMHACGGLMVTTEQAAKCIQGKINGLSTPCATCWGATVPCMVANCKMACLWSQWSDGCNNCFMQNCNPTALSCSGIDPQHIPQ